MIDPASAFFLVDGSDAHWSRGGIRQHGSLTELANCGAQRWIWLVDSRLVQIAEVEMPAASRREQLLALPYAGHRFATGNWRAFIEQSLLMNEGERHLRVFGASEDMVASIASVSDVLLVEGVPGPPRDSLDHLAEGYMQGATLDLLPGLSRRRKVQDTQQMRWWWASAAVLLLTAVGHGGFMALHTAKLERELAAAQARTLSTFHDMFPEIKRVQDVRVQATQALAEAAAASTTEAPFLELLSAAGEPLVSDTGKRLALESASYSSGALELRVRAHDMTVLEGYQQALVGRQLPVSLLSVESRDDKAIGLLRIGQTR